MQKKRSKVITSLALFLISIVGVVAALLSSSSSIANTFILGDSDCEVIESMWVESDADEIMPTDFINKNPAVKNTGNISQYIYMSVKMPVTSSSYESGSGIVTSVASAYDLFEMYHSTDGGVTRTAGVRTSDWTLFYTDSSTTSSGYVTYYYYYNTVVAKNATTSTLFDAIMVANVSEIYENDTDAVFSEADFDIDCQAFAIQVSNTADTPAEAWNILAGQNGISITAPTT